MVEQTKGGIESLHLNNPSWVQGRETVTVVWGENAGMWHQAAVLFSCPKPSADSEVSCVWLSGGVGGAEGSGLLPQDLMGRFGVHVRMNSTTIIAVQDGWVVQEIGAPVVGCDQVEGEQATITGHHFGRVSHVLDTTLKWVQRPCSSFLWLL